MTDVVGAADKLMKLRYAGNCRSCGGELPARVVAVYERTTRTVRCVECPPNVSDVVSRDPSETDAPATEATSTDAGIAGSSARREYERRKAKHEEQLRGRWGKLGGIAVALSDEKQSTRAWEIGAVGEERLGARLDLLVSESVAVLHDRRIPGSKANIDHIAITPAGIWVIDAKRYKGRPELKVEGGVLRPRIEKLVVVVGTAPSSRTVFSSRSSWSAMSSPTCQWPEPSVSSKQTGRSSAKLRDAGVHVLRPKRLAKLLAQAEGPVDVAPVREALAAHFKAS